jgi:hypothetical protein
MENLEQMGFKKFNLYTTKENQQAHLCEFFPDYIPDEDLDVFLGEFLRPPDVPVMPINDTSVLELVRLLSPPKGVS